MFSFETKKLFTFFLFGFRESIANMNNQDIESRLQGIIDSNLMISKRLALKEKRLYKKLNFLGMSNAIFHYKN